MYITKCCAYPNFQGKIIDTHVHTGNHEGKYFDRKNCCKHAKALGLSDFGVTCPKKSQIPKNIFLGNYYVTGQTFLASKGQIFLSSFHPIFSPFSSSSGQAL